MAECTPQTVLDFHPQLPIRLEFDAPQISSDGGAVLLRSTDDRLGLSSGIAELIPDSRDADRVLHSRHEQVMQRAFQIALGYEDANDAEFLRNDPVLKMSCDRTPSDSVGLSSQPTLSRLENAVDGMTIRRLTRWIEDRYVASLPNDSDLVILDIDATDDPTYGQQQLTFFHGYYDQHMYHPLLVFDGETGQLITALLRPGNTHASRGARGVLSRLIRKIKARFPELQIVVRGDSGFAMPRIMEKLESLDEELGDVDYVFGMARNRRLERTLEPEIERARRVFERQGSRAQRFTSFLYAADSWPRERRLIGKAEYSHWGANPRFVVTSLEGFDPETLYRAYCHRGQCENWIKDFKNALHADRLSCSSFTANAFRLIMHLVAYRLLHELRSEVRKHSEKLGRAQFDTLRLRLLKVAAMVRQTSRWIWVRLPKAFPYRWLFEAMATRLNAPPATA